MNTIEQLMQRQPQWQALQNNVRGGQMPCSLLGVAPGARAHLAHLLAQNGNAPVFYAFATDLDAQRAWGEDASKEALFLPAFSPEFYPVETGEGQIALDRAAVFARLQEKRPWVVYLSMDALLFRPGNLSVFWGQCLSLAPGKNCPPGHLRETLSAMGYEYAPMAERPGQFSGRGEILEIFPPGADDPFRLTYFDDEIESIRAFSSETQRSFGGEWESISVAPPREFCLSETQKEKLISFLGQKPEKKEWAEKYAFLLQQSGGFPNMEAFSSLFSGESLLSAFSQSLLLLAGGNARKKEACQREKERAALFADCLQNGSVFGCENDCFFGADAFFAKHAGRTLDLCDLQPLFPQNQIDFKMRQLAGFFGRMDLLAKAISARKDGGYEIYLMAGGKSAALQKALAEEGVLLPIGGNARQCILPKRLAHGFETEEPKAVFFSELDLFGKTKKRVQKKSRAPKTVLGDLKPGDIVVHEINGKGRFLGLKQMEVAGVSAEYMEIAYRGGDKLYLPTAQIDRIEKYIGPGEEEMQLSKLGGKEWENTKAKVRHSLKKLAEDLVAIYGERAQKKGFAFSPDTVWQHEFEENFEYEETPGQLTSIRQIKQDMESEKIMDRLLLGDVGYGKTEVAMRACFKAVMDSKQVAMLVPTTLLARQHYETFQKRFSGFPIKIAMLSRFSKNPKEILEKAKTGAIDILIGTHRLLSKDVQWKDLGLLVVDEEQRFGVSQKERMKDLRRTVDVLTLTATPIPRTLEMAISGVRDMSTIETPPENRKEVRAYVAEFQWNMVRDALAKELARGGQAYFVVRKIGQMDAIFAQLRQLLPQAKIAMAHGQMEERQFETVVSDFYARKYDILLCTTIIESGIDIPSANTMIVAEADQFGLAQLYQLKGRIGRSNVRAYAYFLHLPEDRLSPIAQKRLSAIREFTQFGSGMKIAMRDLEIRGAGNLLGPEQSGHMAKVGYGLYLRMMQETVQEAMGRPELPKIDAVVELGRDALIPDAYLSETAQKMDMYRMIAGIQTLEQAKQVRQTFVDRWGAPPAPVETLLVSALIAAYAGRAQMASVIAKNGCLELKFSETAQISLPKLQRFLKAYEKQAVLRRTTPLSILYRPEKGKLVKGLLPFFDQIRRCISFADQV